MFDTSLTRRASASRVVVIAISSRSGVHSAHPKAAVAGAKVRKSGDQPGVAAGDTRARGGNLTTARAGNLSPLRARDVEVAAQRPPHVARLRTVLDRLGGGAPLKTGQYVVGQHRGTVGSTEPQRDPIMKFR